LGVLGKTPFGTKMSGESVDQVDRVSVHDLTLTKPEPMSKDIDPVAPCVCQDVAVSSLGRPVPDHLMTSRAPRGCHQDRNALHHRGTLSK